MVVEEKKDPNWVRNLKGVVRLAGKKKAFYCRLFDEARLAQAGVKVKDWTSLDENPELIFWEGYFDEETYTAWPEKFVKPPYLKLIGNGKDGGQDNHERRYEKDVLG